MEVVAIARRLDTARRSASGEAQEALRRAVADPTDLAERLTEDARRRNRAEIEASRRSW